MRYPFIRGKIALNLQFSPLISSLIPPLTSSLLSFPIPLLLSPTLSLIPVPHPPSFPNRLLPILKRN
ncbi:MAG: hypothetical protein ABIK99_05115 [candidate division WOR-3 bacterium]